MNFYNTEPKESKEPKEVKEVKPQGPSLKIINVGGTESVTKNMTLYEYGDEIIAVDCGLGIPDSDMLGVDIVIPDFSYLIENKHKLKALVITHGHEDHIGAVPYFLQEFDVPIYANKLVQGFISEKLKDRQNKSLAQKIRFTLLDPDQGELQLSPSFKISAFRVNHSVPASMGFAIKSPEGVVIHMADYKIDWTPVLDPPIDIGRIAALGQQGVLCLLSDCLGVTTEGFSKSESTLNETYHDLFELAKDRQILVTTISSNISRMHQIISAAVRQGRKIVLAGRSIEQSVSVAQRLGYLPFSDETYVSQKEAVEHKQSELVYIVAGCYGQQGSALDRVSRNEHDNITLEDNAMVVFSADPNPPGVEIDVERLMSNLTIAGAEVIYSKIQDNLHVSGHGIKGDLTMIAAVVRPKYFIPLGGTITKMRAYTNMVVGLGFDRSCVFENREGESTVFSGGKAAKGPKIEIKPVYIQSGGEPMNPILLKDRSQLSTDGVFVVVIPENSEGKLMADKADIVTRGFIYVKGSQDLMEKSRRFIEKNVNNNFSNAKDWISYKRKLESDIGHFLRKETSLEPLVIVHTLTI